MGVLKKVSQCPRKQALLPVFTAMQFLFEGLRTQRVQTFQARLETFTLKVATWNSSRRHLRMDIGTPALEGRRFLQVWFHLIRSRIPAWEYYK